MVWLWLVWEGSRKCLYVAQSLLYRGQRGGVVCRILRISDLMGRLGWGRGYCVMTRNGKGVCV